MLKQRIFKIVIALALLAVVGSSGIVADALGLQMTPQVQAGCSGGGGYC
jgi:hypothetical protein